MSEELYYVGFTKDELAEIYPVLFDARKNSKIDSARLKVADAWREAD